MTAPLINAVVRGLFPRPDNRGSVPTIRVFIDPASVLAIKRGTPVVATGATITRNGKTLPAITATPLLVGNNAATNGALKTTGTALVVYDALGGAVDGVAALTAGEAEITYEPTQQYEITINGTGYDGTAAKSYANFTLESATAVGSPYISPSGGVAAESSSSNVQLSSTTCSSGTRNFRIQSVSDPQDGVSTSGVNLIGVIAAHQAI